MGNVEVGLNRDTDLEGAKFVEVIGKVADSGETIREFTSLDLGDGVGEYARQDASEREKEEEKRKLTFGDSLTHADMNLVERVVTVSQKFPGLFTQASD